MTALSDRLRELEDIVGPPYLLTATEAVSQHRVDGQPPLAIVSPGTPEQVGAVLRHATEAGLSVLFRGAGRHLYLGALPGPIGLIVSLARLNQILEFDAENLTLTAQAGVTLKAVQELVGARGQMLPIDPPGGDEATLGGVAATGLAGPTRMRHGAPRDLILGLRVALADGSLVRTGGKTVKNVAGYELTKLFVGSFGTLGALCEITLRLAPVPETKAMLIAALPLERAAEIAGEVLGSSLDVSSLDICNREALAMMRLSLPITVEADTHVLFAGVEGDKESVERQARDIGRMIGQGCARLNGEQSAWACRGLRDAPFPEAPERTIARLGLRPSDVAGVMQAIARSDGWWSLVRLGDGFIYAGPASDRRGAEVMDELHHLRSTAGAAGGYMILESGAPDLKRSFPVWGASPNLDLMRRVKEAYDPARTLGCGRYVVAL